MATMAVETGNKRFSDFCAILPLSSRDKNPVTKIFAFRVNDLGNGDSISTRCHGINMHFIKVVDLLKKLFEPPVST